jgi:glycosyltransferase involved in cell wall biosynthesis
MPLPRKKRLAIFAPGGVGVGVFSQGVPALATLVARLAERFDVTFYSLASTDAGFEPVGYRLRSPPTTFQRAGVPRGRWLYMMGRFLRDHGSAKYDAMLSFWGYPIGAAVVALSRTVAVPTVVMLLGAETADVPAIGYGHLGRPLRKWLILWTCARASALVAVSQYQLNVLARSGFHRDDAQVIPIGAEAEMFAFQASTPGAPLKIIHVANLTEVKDQATLLRAFARLRADIDARLRIVGSDAMGGTIHDLVRELHLESAVEVVGAVRFTLMPMQYRWADMFVLTSLSEGQNRSLTEAAMSGVLQVSTPVGHIADLGEDVAVLIKPGDPEDIARRIKAIVNDGPGWARRVHKARAWAAAHDMGWTVERLAEVIDGVAPI